MRADPYRFSEAVVMDEEPHMRGCSSRLCKKCGMPEDSDYHGPRLQTHDFEPEIGDCDLCKLRARVQELESDNKKLSDQLLKEIKENLARKDWQRRACKWIRSVHSTSDIFGGAEERRRFLSEAEDR